MIAVVTIVGGLTAYFASKALFGPRKTWRAYTFVMAFGLGMRLAEGAWFNAFVDLAFVVFGYSVWKCEERKENDERNA